MLTWGTCRWLPVVIVVAIVFAVLDNVGSPVVAGNVVEVVFKLYYLYLWHYNAREADVTSQPDDLNISKAIE